jgi:hypothetical protein
MPDHYDRGDEVCGACLEEWPCRGSHGYWRSGVDLWRQEEVEIQREIKREKDAERAEYIWKLSKSLGYEDIAQMMRTYDGKYKMPAYSRVDFDTVVEMMERIAKHELGDGFAGEGGPEDHRSGQGTAAGV